jgi:hypothetical protein
MHALFYFLFFEENNYFFINNDHIIISHAQLFGVGCDTGWAFNSKSEGGATTAPSVAQKMTR